MPVSLVVGCDPGKRGGYACINERGVHAYLMDLDKFSDLLWSADRVFSGSVVVYLEDVHAMPKQGVSSTFTFGEQFGILQGIINTRGLRTVRVSPQKWKNVVLGKSYIHDKAGTIRWAMETYPQVNLIPDRCHMPQDGLADALAIAHFGWNKENGNAG